jgi:hypothetical protein
MKLSVFEDFVRDNGHYEIYADNDGVVRKFDIGATSANVTERYRVPTRQVTNAVSQVKVVGFDSPPCLYMGDTYSIIPDTANDFESEQIQPLHLLVQDTCYELVFDRYAYFCYRAPNYASKFNDSIDSLFEEGYDETVIAWAHNLEGADNMSDRGSINFSEYTFYPVSIGTAPEFDEITLFPINIEYVSEQEARCWIAPEESRISYSLDLTPYKYPDPDLGNQLVSDVEELAYFIITGYKATYATSWPARTLSGRNIQDQHVTYVELKDTKEAIALQEGTDYVAWFDGEDVLNISAGFVQKYSWEEFGYQYYLRDWEYLIGYTGEQGFFWPRLGGTGLDSGGLGTAMWVTGMYLVLRRKLNSVTIFDPDGAADFVLDNLLYEITPIIQKDARPPTCGAGIFQGCVDWNTTVFDDDPLTIQDLYKTSDIARLNEAMAQGVSSVSIDAPYLVTEEEVQTAANKIYGLFNDEDLLNETTYVCSPESDPRLGQLYGEGVVNSISYSYNDQSAYTVSITSGPRHLREFPGTGTNIWMMETETIKRRGTITQSSGDGLYYVVSVEGLGEFIAVNVVVGESSPEIGDTVDVEINNIPMGWA